MAWGKIDDKLHSHVKWRRASKGARALWATALSWCCEHPTDGFVPADMLRALDGTKGEAERLVEVGLWEKADGGYRFHQWSERNPDSASTKAKQAAESEAGSFGNHRRWHVKRRFVVPDCEWCQKGDTPSGTRSGHPIATRIGGESPVPVPVPNRDRETVTSPPRGDRDAAPPQLETSIPRHVLPASWAPTTSHKAYALENGIDLKHEDRQFRAHCKSKRVTSLDWDAEFDKWLGNAVTRRRPSGPADRPRPGSSVWDKPARGDEPA
ncbi:hypothetical protein ACFT5B_06850 [Luteimicrobium sp. NPDC057192]|uniref:hypothetical protein n=1 Tax=Luteimicrobium sp. NPDC057192 TaxID=3346042 RepID=UPI0036453A85